MKITCHDCGVKEGEFHKEGCDMERCSKCGAQVLMHGRCKGAKPEPFFNRVFSCVRCGEIFPDIKMVSDEEWSFICGGTYDKKNVLCGPCMKFIKEKRGMMK